MSSLRYLCLFVHSGVQHIFSEMSVFIAPFLVFANIYLYNYICRLSTYQESNR